jgi:hypothetical protein
MIVCPVCETQVDFGFECEVCGKDLSGVLGALPPAPVTILKMAELEVTIPDRVGEIAIERAPDVEVTAFAKVAEVASAPIPDFEKTVNDKIGEIPVLPINDISEDRVPDDGVRTAIQTGPLTCRYCKTVQTSPGTICEKCGMKLPQVAVAAVAGPKKKKLEVWTRCRACAAPALGGEHCRECGREVPMPEL